MIALKESAGLLAALVVLAAATYLTYPPLAILPVAFFAFTLYFFRDPQRNIPQDKNVIVSPADGKVLDVEDVKDPFVGPAKRISIFMSPFNVHVNRSPYAGTVKSVKHTPGVKVAAYLKGDLNARERNRIEFEGQFNFAVEQYAGVLARRIVCYVKPGESLNKGDKIGLIKFGSRVDLIIPSTIKVKVSSGARMVAGETIAGALDG